VTGDASDSTVRRDDFEVVVGSRRGCGFSHSENSSENVHVHSSALVLSLKFVDCLRTLVGMVHSQGVSGGEVGGPTSRSRVTTSVVVVVVVFAVLVRSLSLSMGFALFSVRSLLVSARSVSGARSVYRLGVLSFDPIYTSLHTFLIDRHFHP
jgi:hypothetical protein